MRTSVLVVEGSNRALKLAAGGTVEAAIVAMSRGPAATAIWRELRGVVPKMIVLADAAYEEPDLCCPPIYFLCGR
jgi:hypothetical protein